MEYFKQLVRHYNARKNERYFPYREYHKRNRCIFIHVPRVAGSSILTTLGESAGGRDHLPWYVYYTANPTLYERSFKFAFVRNPWSRILSAYVYLANGGNRQSDLRISELIKKYINVDRFVIEGLGRGKFRNHLLFIPQSEFVIKGEGDLAVDFLGKYETILEDFSVIASRLGLKNSLPVLNQSSSKTYNYRSAFKDDRAISIIENLYLQDIKTFQYQF